MPAIHTHNFLVLSGQVNPGTGEQVETITRPGVDGTAFRKIGKKGRSFSLQSTVDTESAANAKALIENYKTLQGSIVNIVDATGQTWSNFIVLQVQPAKIAKIMNAAGGLTATPAYLVSANWTLQAV